MTLQLTLVLPPLRAVIIEDQPEQEQFCHEQESPFAEVAPADDLTIAKLTPEKYQEISRAHLLDPTNRDPGRLVVWSHQAFANQSVYARNDQEIVCVSLAAASAR